MSVAPANKILHPCLPGFDHIKRYWDHTNQLFAAKILPGEFYVSKQDEVIVTVLGSCVSACIRDPKLGIGGMNHFMLPASVSMSDWDGTNELLATRYGNFAMEHLINEILKNGGKRERLEVKVFGGGRIIGEMTDVGRKNADFVLAYLGMENMKPEAEDLGDIYPRKVYYFPVSGKVRLKKLRSLHNDTVIKREKEYMKELKSAPDTGDVELF